MATIATLPSSDLDPWSAESLADPYPTYRALRDTAAVVWLPRYRIAALARYDETRAALSDPGRFSSVGGGCVDEQQSYDMGENLLTSDPPAHGFFRKPLAGQLSVAALKSDESTVVAAADRLADRLVREGRFDAVADMASPYSVNVVCDLIGLPDEGRERVGPWGERAFNTMGPRNARLLDGIVALQQLSEWTVGMARAGRLCPGSRGEQLARAGWAEAITAYTWPGIDTTVHALSSAVLCFAQHPEQWQMVRDDRSLIPAAFHEVLRVHAPVQTFARVATTDVELGGHVIPARTRVAVMFGSANRDERRYPDPDRFDITRNPLDHLAFGRGPHLCVGINLAKIEAHSLLGALADRVERFELTGEPVWTINNALHGLAALPVRVVAASPAPV